MNKQSKPTVTIGIPAFNEAANIGTLIGRLLAQKIPNAEIDRLIIVSDGSTDRTADIVRGFSDPRIKLIEHAKREGIGRSQQDITRQAKGDILVLLNADVLPENDTFIEEIIAPLRADPIVGLVSAATVSALARNGVESIVATSHAFKQFLYERVNGGRTIYLCHGRARAFSRAFYSEIDWPEDLPEDSFSYLLALERGFGSTYAPKARIIFRSPQTLRDHARQSRRFWDGTHRLEERFPRAVVRREFRIPPALLAVSFIRYSFQHPLRMFGYCVVSAVARFWPLNAPLTHRNWEVSESTKSISVGTP